MKIFVDAVPSSDEIGKIVAPLDMIIAVGFGTAQVIKGDKVIFRESNNDEDFHCLQEFEHMAQIDPDHDWRILLDAPLQMREYQRQENRWVVIDVGPGFA